MNYQPSILVIDDEKYVCTSCDRLLSQAGYKVDTNINPEKGFNQALMNNYDALVLDLKLGEVDGIDLLNDIRGKKPDLPVVIITGYPTPESRQQSEKLGVSDYILKPFEPEEFLNSLKRATYKASVAMHKEVTPDEESKVETRYRFTDSSWIEQVYFELVRVGGHLPNLMDATVKSIKLPKKGDMLYRGLPLAEVTLDNKTKRIISSPVTGEVTEVNTDLLDHPEIVEKNSNWENWIAVVRPCNLEQALAECDTRKVLFMSKDREKENAFTRQFKEMGYVTRMADSIEESVEILSNENISVLVMDGTSFPYDGPDYVKRINQVFTDTKIIVFNEPFSAIENNYRENKVFYYGVNPISKKEMADVLNCAFSREEKATAFKTGRLSFLPNSISKIRVTNRSSKKVSIFAFDDILQNNQGIGYLLIQELSRMSFPVAVSHTRTRRSLSDPAELQKINDEKEDSDRIIILQTKDKKNIQGTLEKEVQPYENSRGTGNRIITLSVQPATNGEKPALFDNYTTRALVEMMKKEITGE